MNRVLSVACLGLNFLVVFCFTAQAAEFTPLFNGQDLSGWVREGEAGFSWQDGMLFCNGSGNEPTWLRSEKQYENFILRLEYKLGVYGEGGVFLHAPLHGRNSEVGFEIQVSDDTRNIRPVELSSGAVFGVLPPRVQSSRPFDSWNSMEIYFNWPRLRVTLNDVIVQDLHVTDHPELRERLRSGYLGFQDRGKPTAYRNIEIRELPSTMPPWQSLFNGHDFTGWFKLQEDDASWTIDDGDILAADGNGYLVTEEQYRDFEFETYLRSSHLANGGIFFRWKSLVPKDRGFEIQIEDIRDSNNPTGSIYDVRRSREMPIEPGQWYLMQVRVVGNYGQVRVNGRTVAETYELPVNRAGHVALQMHRHGSWIRFREPRIRRIETLNAAD